MATRKRTNAGTKLTAAKKKKTTGADRPARTTKQAKATSKTVKPSSAKKRTTSARRRAAPTPQIPLKFRAALSAAAKAGETRPIPPHFIVFLPGFLGSKLADAQEKTVWIEPTKFPVLNPLQWGAWFQNLFDKMQYPQPKPELQLHPKGVIDSLFGPLAFEQQYIRLKELLKGWGYEVDPSPNKKVKLDKPILYTFAYDWRQDNRKSAAALKDFVDTLAARHPDREVYLAGHSNGGIVSRWYLKFLGGKDVVKRLFLFASPWDGAPGSMYHLFAGFDRFWFIPLDQTVIPQRTREILSNFPAIYQLIPQAQNFFRDLDDQPVNPFVDVDWLPPEKRALLQDAQQFNLELGNDIPVKTLAFVGYKKPTMWRGHQLSKGKTRWDQLRWDTQELTGDGTVPFYSAVYDDAEIKYVIALHADIYANEDVQDRLFYELIGQYKGIPEGMLGDQTRRTDAATRVAPLATQPGGQVEVSLMLTVRQDKPGMETRPEELQTVEADSTPVGKLLWLEPLPLSKKKTAPRNLPSFFLQAVDGKPGSYQGSLTAPKQEGHYVIETKIQVSGEPTITVRDLFTVSPVA